MHVKIFNNVKHQSLFEHVLYYKCYSLIYTDHVIRGRLVTGTLGAKIQNSVNVQSYSSVTGVGCGIRRRRGANRNEHKSLHHPKLEQGKHRPVSTMYCTKLFIMS